VRLLFDEACIDIGICVRKCEAFVKEAVDSVLDQDFPHELIEVIFVDDGSEDRILSVVDCISRMDTEAKVFHDEWRGLGRARNVVFENAGEDCIVWVDSFMCLMFLDQLASVRSGFAFRQAKDME